MVEAARILIADDEEVFLESTRDLLGREGYTCTCVRDVAAATARLRAERFDLLITDLRMPDADGLRLVGEAHTLRSGLPVILVTAYPTLESAVASVRLPVVDYLIKPFRLEDLLDAVERAIGRGSEAMARAWLGRRLRISETRFEELFEASPDGIVTTDEAGVIREVNAACERLFGYARAELIGRPIEVLLPECLRAAHGEARRRFVSRPHYRPMGSGLAIRGRRKDGNEFRCHVALALLPTESGLQVSAIVRDISEHERVESALRESEARFTHLATHDALTELINRSEFEARLQRLVARMPRAGSTHAVLCLDLDQFKVINETCGHSAGDALLRELARLLRACVRDCDTVARLGGDEFGVLLEDCDLERALERAEAMRRAVVAHRFSWGGRRFHLGLSAGLVPLTGELTSVSDILRIGDSACFLAKEQGGNRVHVYRAGDAGIVRWEHHLAWVARLQEALDEDAFVLHAQPIVALDPRAPAIGHEVLLRLRERGGSMVTPAAFLSAAERFRLAPQLDRWVLQRVIAWFADVANAVGTGGALALNLSGQSLDDPELERLLGEALADGRLPGRRLCFEITETGAIANLDRALAFIAFARGHGCRFALDDFGTGLSSFGYLRDLPVDIVKIDGSFVRDVDADPMHLAMVRSINEVAHVMGKRTVAEHVENGAVLAELERIGVDYVQGYHIGRPRALA